MASTGDGIDCDATDGVTTAGGITTAGGVSCGDGSTGFSIGLSAGFSAGFSIGFSIGFSVGEAFASASTGRPATAGDIGAVCKAAAGSDDATAGDAAALDESDLEEAAITAVAAVVAVGVVAPGDGFLSACTRAAAFAMPSATSEVRRLSIVDHTLGDTAQSTKRQTRMHKNGHIGSNRRRLIEMPSSKQVDTGAQGRPRSRKSLLRSAAWAGQVEFGCREVSKILNGSSRPVDYLAKIATNRAIRQDREVAGILRGH